MRHRVGITSAGARAGGEVASAGTGIGCDAVRTTLNMSTGMNERTLTLLMPDLVRNAPWDPPSSASLSACMATTRGTKTAVGGNRIGARCCGKALDGGLGCPAVGISVCWAIAVDHLNISMVGECEQPNYRARGDVYAVQVVQPQCMEVGADSEKVQLTSAAQYALPSRRQV